MKLTKRATTYPKGIIAMNTHTSSDETLTRACLESCRAVLARIKAARQQVMAQFRGLIADHEQALRLALNEAEALAWQTPYPDLVFTDLAEEKARAVAAWTARQQVVRRRSFAARAVV